MKRFFCLLLKSRGFSLTEVMVATVLMSMAGVALMELSQLVNHDSLQLRATRVTLTARARIEAALKNPVSWRQTVNQNAVFNCASTAPGCSLAPSNDGYYDFVLYGVGTGERVTYDPADPTTRYSIRGGPCPAGTGNPDSQCPIKYVARMKPLCQAYPCTNPTLDIKVSLVLEFGTNKPPLNPQKYEYATVRGLDDGSLESACRVLNGTYNSIAGTCLPKTANRSCAGPGQIISSVAADGSLTCAPLYTGQCNPATQVMSGVDANGVAQCAPRSQPPTCPTNCSGGWGPCSTTCGPGTQTYGIITPASNGGAACTSPAPGDVQACNLGACAVNCVGSWSPVCTQPCGGGKLFYSITTPAANGGAACPNLNGDSLDCNTQACGVPVDCAVSPGPCDPATGLKTLTVTQVPQNGGAPCPSPLTQTCAVDCAGNWSACAGGPPAYKTYTWTHPSLNGGLACQYPNGQTDTGPCTTLLQVGSCSTSSFSGRCSNTGNHCDATVTSNGTSVTIDITSNFGYSCNFTLTPAAMGYGGANACMGITSGSANSMSIMPFTGPNGTGGCSW